MHMYAEVHTFISTIHTHTMHAPTHTYMALTCL